MKKNIKLIPLFLFLFVFQLLYFLSTIYTEKIDHMFLILAVFMVLICILLYCVLSDVLKKSNAEMELAFLQKQKQLKQEREHIDELNKQRQYFFATASHELKTPITIIKGQVESMIMGIGRYKDTHEVLPETLKEIENMEQLVKEILSISKLEMNAINHM